MNKTININLANTFFHIDEDAYNKLQRYLEAIKRSFTNSQGRDEIIADIEARIAELFTEKLTHERQVISTKEVDEVIAVMGQPEDYLVDEEIFDDAPRAKTTYHRREYKQLYRDTENKYIGGVSSGLGHYLGIDAVWVRLLWLLAAFASGGTFIFIYILFWILVPEAVTTAQKLAMKGEPVNISNIEKKVKEGIDNVAEKVKNVDYEKAGEKVKNTSRSFFDTLGDIIMFCFKIFAKFIGIILIITGISALIGLFIGMVTVGIADVVHLPGVDFVDLFNTSGTPTWLASLLLFFAIGIPFFFLFYLGLKILVNNLKSMGNIAKFSLLGLWLLSIIGLVVMGMKTAAEFSTQRSVYESKPLTLNPTDTLFIKATDMDKTDYLYYGDSDFSVLENDNGEKLLYSEEVTFDIVESDDSIPQIKVRKKARGSNSKAAEARAEAIVYAYSVNNNVINLNNYFVTAFKNKFREQDVEITLYLPKNTLLIIDEEAEDMVSYDTDNDRDYYRGDLGGYLWKVDGLLKCQNCPDEKTKNTNESNINVDEEGVNINIQGKNGKELNIKADSAGVKIKSN